MGRKWIAVLVAAPGLVGSCSLLTSLDGLSGPDSPGADAGDAGDAGSDTSDGDVDDGLPDAPFETSDGPAIRFCDTVTPPPAFCADFDGANAKAEDGWSGHEEGGGATSSLDHDVFHSGPASLGVHVPPIPDGGWAKADLVRAAAGAAAETSLTFDFRADTYTDSNVGGIALAGDGSASPYSASLVFGSGYASLMEEAAEDGGPYFYTTLPGAPPLGQWTTVTLIVHSVDRGAGTDGWVTVEYDGAVVLDKHPITTKTAFGVPTITLGAAYVQNSPTGWAANFDNVVIRAN